MSSEISSSSESSLPSDSLLLALSPSLLETSWSMRRVERRFGVAQSEALTDAPVVRVEVPGAPPSVSFRSSSSVGDGALVDNFLTCFRSRRLRCVADGRFFRAGRRRTESRSALSSNGTQCYRVGRLTASFQVSLCGGQRRLLAAVGRRRSQQVGGKEERRGAESICFLQLGRLLLVLRRKTSER